MGLKICAKCNREIIEKNSPCKYCGETKHQLKKSRILIIGVVLLLLIAIPINMYWDRSDANSRHASLALSNIHTAALLSETSSNYIITIMDNWANSKSDPETNFVTIKDEYYDEGTTNYEPYHFEDSMMDVFEKVQYAIKEDLGKEPADLIDKSKGHIDTMKNFFGNEKTYRSAVYDVYIAARELQRVSFESIDRVRNVNTYFAWVDSYLEARSDYSDAVADFNKIAFDLGY